MIPKWLSNFRQYLDRQARILEKDGYGQSRKVSDFGWYDAHEEIRCFGAIHYYFQKGLGEQAQRIEQVLNMVHHYQKDNGRGTYTAHFYPFGFSDPNLKTHGAKQASPSTRMQLFSQGICNFSGTTEPEDTATIQIVGPAGSEDFSVFFCLTRSVSMNINAARRYVRMKERCAWFFLAGEDPEWEPGNRFRPETEPIPPSPPQ